MLCILCLPKLTNMGLVGEGRYSNSSLAGRVLVPASLIAKPAFSSARTPNGSGSSRDGSPKPSASFRVASCLSGLWVEDGLDFGFDQVGNGTDGNGIIEDMDGGIGVVYLAA